MKYWRSIFYMTPMFFPWLIGLTWEKDKEVLVHAQRSFILFVLFLLGSTLNILFYFFITTFDLSYLVLILFSYPIFFIQIALNITYIFYSCYLIYTILLKNDPLYARYLDTLYSYWDS